MSFQSCLVLARAAPPPVVTAAAIGAFLRSLDATGALAGGGEPLCQIKYGPRVDADDRTTDVIDWDESNIIGTLGDYPWDVSQTFPSVAVLADALAVDGRPVYRAYLGLGALHAEIVAALTRAPSEENEVGLCLYEADFSVGPVLVAGLYSEAPALAGWMGLSLSGPGYFFPWEYRQARQRAEAVALVRRLTEACRAAWPVVPAAASAEAHAGRRGLGELWLYDDFAVPQDWLWFVSESG
jgi:hypothetical protein